jgi:hypothetical protein
VKVYLLMERDPAAHYARFSHVGTWSPGGICPGCECGTSRLIESLQVQWKPGSTVLGDFSWCGYTAVVVPPVRAFLESQQFPCRFGATVVVPPCERYRPDTVIPFPYQGPPLHWLICNELVGIDVAASGVRLETDCTVCRRKRYNFRMEGIVIDRREWSGQKTFRIRHFEPSAATYVTEEGRERIEQQGFSNFGYIDAGMIA